MYMLCLSPVGLVAVTPVWYLAVIASARIIAVAAVTGTLYVFVAAKSATTEESRTSQ